MYKVPPPELQIDFSLKLEEIRRSYLQDALRETVRSTDIATIDQQLAAFVPAESLAAVASRGLRGELLFPVPILLQSNPRLLGYYRLLYGFSQKLFYTTATGISRFKSMETRGVLSDGNASELDGLTRALVAAGVELLDGINGDRLSQHFLDDLTLLTLGPQLRGGANVQKGAAGIVKVFEAIHEIVAASVTESVPTRIQLENAAGRVVLIEFAPDPDIIIRERMAGGDNFRLLIAIEVKGGTDFSNIHNRVGEAEKSHQKARRDGYTECWTVVNVDNIDMRMAHRESPSTNRFYRMSDLEAREGTEYADFRARIISLTGIRDH